MARGRQALGATGEDLPVSLSAQGTTKAKPLLECLSFLNIPDFIRHLWVSPHSSIFFSSPSPPMLPGPLND